MSHFRGQFVAVDPAGVRYTLLAWEDGDGAVTVETSDGNPVARVGHGRYQLVRHNLVVELTSDDPSAP
jgi:hypothetical protein